MILRKNLSGSKIIKFQQSQALTSHFESFWSIVQIEVPKTQGVQNSINKLCLQLCLQFHKKSQTRSTHTYLYVHQHGQFTMFKCYTYMPIYFWIQEPIFKSDYTCNFHIVCNHESTIWHYHSVNLKLLWKHSRVIWRSWLLSNDFSKHASFKFLHIY